MSTLLGEGKARKMQAALEDDRATYTLHLGEHSVAMNTLLGKSLSIEHTGSINCVNCDRLTKKSFNQGYCYPCFKNLAQCDLCIMSPERCHYAAGTCREPEWGEQNCMIDHFVYLSNTSGVKVGITRHSQVPTRWIDQGASQAQPIFRVASRLLSGLIESLFKAHVADKTHWQKMLKGEAESIDLEQRRQELMQLCKGDIEALQATHGLQAITALESAPTTEIIYPVLEYPTKVRSLNLDKTPEIGGTLLGIKGQYLIFDTGVINLRKYGGYQLKLSI